MTLADGVIIVILFFFALEGLGKPVLKELIDLGSFLLAFFLSLRFYNLASRQLETLFSLPHSFANALGFILIWYLVEIIFIVLIKIFFKAVPLKINFWGSRVLGVLPAFFKGLIFVAVLLVLLSTFPIQPRVKKEIDKSLIASTILDKTYRIEVPLKNIFGDLASDTLTFLTIKPKSDETVNLGFQTGEFTFDPNIEREMIVLVNKERSDLGIPTLAYDSNLQNVGRKHSTDMFLRGYFSHYSPAGRDVADRATEENITFLVIGENLAYAPTLPLAHQGLMNSEGHRANILSEDYHKIGIGIAKSEDFGLMVTQVFSN